MIVIQLCKLLVFMPCSCRKGACKAGIADVEQKRLHSPGELTLRHAPCWECWSFILCRTTVLELRGCLHACSCMMGSAACTADHLVQGQLAGRRHQPDPLVPDLQWQPHSATHGELTLCFSAIDTFLPLQFVRGKLKFCSLSGSCTASVSTGLSVPAKPSQLVLRRSNDRWSR